MNPYSKFDTHRAFCGPCGRSPYSLCKEGADLLIAEDDAIPSHHQLVPLTTHQIAALVARRLREPCASCGGALVWKNENVVCPQRGLGSLDEDAIKHSLFPIDTGPFSLGRRVD